MRTRLPLAKLFLAAFILVGGVGTAYAGFAESRYVPMIFGSLTAIAGVSLGWMWMMDNYYREQ